MKKMKKTTILVALSLVLGVTGCEKQDTYPITGEACGPEDPVKTLDAKDCVPA